MSDDVAGRLAKALSAPVPGRPDAPVVRIWGRGVDAPNAGAETNLWAGTPMDVAELLLPVVREIADLRAAEELDREADRIEAKSSHCYDEDDEAWEEDARDLRARAAALRGEATP